MANTAQHCAPAPGEQGVLCSRCNGSGQYLKYGACWRCNGTGLVAPARIRAFFREVEAPPAPEPQATLEAAKAEAVAKAKQLKAERFVVYKLSHYGKAVELLARHRNRPGETLHITWHSRGMEREWVPCTPATLWKDITS